MRFFRRLTRRTRLAFAFLVVCIAIIGFCGNVVGRSLANAQQSLHPRRHAVVRPARVGALSRLVDVSFQTRDHLTLRGWYIASHNRAAVVILHGVGDTRADMLSEARLLAGNGYGVLLFDWRGHGESGGNLVTWGDRERMDLSAAMDLLAARPDVDVKCIGVLGFSMGAYIAACVAATDHRIAALVLEGCVTSLDASMHEDFGKWGALSVLPAIWWYRHEGIDFDAVKPLQALAAIRPRPVFLINGTIDDTDAVQEAELCKAIGADGECWTIQGAVHGRYVQAAPVDYGRRLVRFFDTALTTSRRK